MSRVDPGPKLNTRKKDQTQTSANEQEDNTSISKVEDSANKFQRSPRWYKQRRRAASAIVAEGSHVIVLAIGAWGARSCPL